MTTPRAGMDRAHIGAREIDRATAGAGVGAVAAVREASPVLADGVEQFIFADVFSRPGLTARERELLTVAVLCVIGGAERQLGLHVPAALTCGADPDELVALCEQIAPYAGFPRALNALRSVREVLAARDLPLPLPVERMRVTDHETAVIRAGEGPPVVLVHPLGLDRMLWRDVVRALSPRRTVVVPDLRGHGDASGAAAPDPEAIVTDLVALVERLDLHEVVLAGAGSGAWLAAMAGARLEDRVERVVLVGPSDAPTPADPADALLAWATPRTIARDPWVVRHVRDRLARPPAAAVPLLERRLLESAPRGPAGRTEIVLGAEDPGAAAGPGPRIVAGAAGLVALDAPEGVAEVLAGT